MHSRKKFLVSFVLVLILLLASTMAVLVVGNWQSNRSTHIVGAGTIHYSGNPSIATSSNIMPKVVGNISLGFYGISVIALDTNNHYLYMLDSGAHAINVVNPSNNSIVTNISMQDKLSSIAFDAQNGNLYVAENGDIAVINGTTNSVFTYIIVNGNVSHIIYDSVSGMLFASVSDSVSGYGYVLELNGTTNQVQYKITGFNDPYGMAVDTSNGNIYVADQGQQGIDIINGSTSTIEKSIGLGADAVNLAYDSTDNWMFLTNGYNVTVFNASNASIVRNISVANYIYNIVYDNSTGNIYAGGDQQSYLYVLDPATGGTVKMIPVPSGGSYIFFDWQNGNIYTSLNAYEIMILNGTTNDIAGYLKIGEDPSSIAYDGSTGDIYASEVPDTRLQVVGSSAGKQEAFIGVGKNAYAVLADPQVGKVFVSDYGSNQVSVINDKTLKVEGTVNVGTSPYGMALDKSNGILYVMNSNSANISMINASSGQLQGTIYVGTIKGILTDPYQAAWDSVNHNVYFTDSYGNSVVVLNTSTDSIGESIPLSNIADGITFDSQNQDVYVTSGQTVWAINTTTNSIAGSISLGNIPNAILFDPFSGDVFCANTFVNKVAVIDGSQNKLIGNITVGASPNALALNTHNGDMYVSNSISNNLTVIGLKTFNTTFTETGLTSGSWYVNITGSAPVTSGPINNGEFSIGLPNGQYHFTISSNGKYNVTPQSGNFTISNTNYTRNVVFKALPPPVAGPLSVPEMALIFLVLVGLAALVVYTRNKR